MARFFYMGTHGPDAPTQACLPFHLAINGHDVGLEADLFLTGDAVALLKDAVIESLVPCGIRPLRDLLRDMVALDIPIFL
jgi:predicted peroxiredoxin